jgi:F-type H+-transporting ATPase subunit a
MALSRHKLNFFSSFMPAGTPVALAILLVPIELLSFTARALSLGFRLCINVSSGHLLTVILADFSFKFLQAQSILFKLASVVPAFIIFALSFLEAGILVMQAFIFTTLTAIYISEAIDLH